MYNQERKEQFLQEKERETTISNNLKNMFQMAERFEELYERDLCEFTTQDIISLYKYYSTPNIQTLIQINNSLEMYTNWCINNGLVPDNQNHYSEMKSEILCECVDLNVLKTKIFTRNDLMNWLQKLPNYVDRFIFLGIFEGIPVLDGCLTDARLADLNDNILTLSNGTKRVLSRELVNIMWEADAEVVRLSMGEQQRQRNVQYASGDTIIRPAVNSAYTDNKPTLLVGSRVRMCCKFLGINVTIKNISECGRMWYIKQIADEHGCSITDATVKYRRDHEEIYGKVQNMLTYSLTYGKLINDLY